MVCRSSIVGTPRPTTAGASAGAGTDVGAGAVDAGADTSRKTSRVRCDTISDDGSDTHM